MGRTLDLKELNRTGAARHPWEQSRLKLFADILRRNLELRSVATVLDVGSGDGWFSVNLLKARDMRHFQVACWDHKYSESLVNEVGLSEHENIKAVSLRPESHFDLILMLDVVEHVEDDTAFLHETVDVNMPSAGYALISVPAWPALFSSHDTALGHYRRYRPSALRDLAQRCNLQIVDQGNAFISPLPLRALTRLREATLGAGSSPRKVDTVDWPFGIRTTRVFTTLLGWDHDVNRLASRLGVELPGLSTWVLCQKN